MGISPAASAINLTIGNTSSLGSAGALPGRGQSFINDPSGTGETIFLNSWTFAFTTLTGANNAKTGTLGVYVGAGNGGTKIGVSTGAANTIYAGNESVIWSFSNLQVTDNLTYTVVFEPSFPIGSNAQFTNTDPYPNGSFTNGTSVSSANEFVFEGTFSSVTPVPFEFNPALGLGVLGGLVAFKRLFKKKVK